jgi:hypothetical protein
VAELFVELGVEVVRGLAGEDCSRGEAAAVEREREAVAGEGGDDGGLVADGPEVFGDGVAAEQAIRDGADGKRSREERLGASETRAEVRGLGEEGEECVPAAAGVAKEIAADDEAEVNGVVFDEGKAAVSAGDEEELDGVAELGELIGREAEVHLEADEVGVGSKQRAREAAEVVLAGGEKDVWSGESVGVIGAGDGDAPEIVDAMEGFGGVAAEDDRTGG